jgi:GNAT superfamily N-acetyltransferase
MRIEEAKEIHASDIVEFQIAMAKETEDLELDRSLLEAGVASVFKDNTRGRYYIAVEDKTIVGSFLTTYEWSDWRNGQVVWLQSVFVRPEYRGKGVFRLMYDHIRNMVLNNQYKGIRLYVERNNDRARKVYENMGMVSHHYDMYEWMK